MNAPVIPCASTGETAEDLRCLRSAFEAARYHADRIRAGAEVGNASHFQALEAAELAGIADVLRGDLLDVFTAEVAAVARPQAEAA